MNVVEAGAVGVMAGSGVVAVVSGARRRMTVQERLDPYVRGLEPSRSRVLMGDPLPAPSGTVALVVALALPLLTPVAQRLNGLLGGSAAAQRRLALAGHEGDLGRFRVEQVLWALTGFVASVALTILLPVLLGTAPDAALVLALAALGMIAGVVGRDAWLQEEVRRRERAILAELPSWVDVLCLSVMAGEGLRAALERTTARCGGQLREEWERVLADTRCGTPLVSALARLGERLPIPDIVRLVDALIVAVERGTPMAEVLRNQAADVREQHKRRLLERGGRNEVLMLVPVVFLVLPVIVVFALYPGYVALSTLAG